jgi:hypothetical protein
MYPFNERYVSVLSFIYFTIPATVLTALVFILDENGSAGTSRNVAIR